MTNTSGYIETEKVEQYLDELLYQYRFSRTELAKILHAEVDDVRNGVDGLSLEQEKSLANFRFHVTFFNKQLGYKDKSMVADWFFKPFHDNFICSPFDVYMKEGFCAVRDVIHDRNIEKHLRIFYPEYKKSNQVIIPTVLGDGQVIFSVCENMDNIKR